jgi:Fe2+ or Zn2+ uptake regulation protein
MPTPRRLEQTEEVIEQADDSPNHVLMGRRTRNTQQRRAVYEAVQSFTGQHPTAADIFASLRESHPNMSLATVYRALHALVEQNAICEVRIENTARYDAGACPHHHVICRVCGEVADVCPEALPDGLPEIVLKAMEACTGYCLDIHPIQVSGICAACRARRS